MDNYNNDSLYSFNFKSLYEGVILEVYNDNSCLINIPKLLIGQENTSKVEGEESIVNNNIINNFTNKSSVKIINGIICHPYEKNNSSIKMEVGNKVTVFFIDDDPNKAFYIDSAYQNRNEYNKDIIYKKDQISIYIEDGNIILKNCDNIFKITPDNIIINKEIVKEDDM